MNKLPVIGYIGDLFSGHAGYRYRVEATKNLHGLDYAMGGVADVTVIFRTINTENFIRLKNTNFKSIFDITDFHLDKNNEIGSMQRAAIVHATVTTVSSKKLKEKIYKHYRINCEVIEDCYTNEELQPSINNNKILWFGHQSNYDSLKPYIKLENLIVCSKSFDAPNLVPFSISNELQLLEECGLVLLTSNNPLTNGNRIIRALRAGRFVITPNTNIESWNELKDFIWRGDVSEGIKWALTNKEEAISKVKNGQDYIREKFSPQTISNQWRELFIRVYNS